jgi:hypothetical protein
MHVHTRGSELIVKNSFDVALLSFFIEPTYSLSIQYS